MWLRRVEVVVDAVPAAGTSPAPRLRRVDCARGPAGSGRAPGARGAISLAGVVLLLAAASAAAAEAPAAAARKESPWIFVPTLSSSPKLGTSLGAMAGYLTHFDAASQVSMFAVSAQYTSTDSAVGALLANASFGADRNRVLALLAGGRIKNDYDDFLGTGQPLKTEDNLHVLVARYLRRTIDDWFIGVQGLYSNYQILGQSALDDEFLAILGLEGFASGGVGLLALHDSRDNQYSPTRGWYLSLNNIAYRDWIAGEENFDVYRLEAKAFWEHAGGWVLAVRQNNQWSAGAPSSAYPSVTLRGYKIGQYLGPSQSSLEVEERFRFARKWGATLFAGVACLYGGGGDCSESENLYPSAGAGLQYVLKESEGMVLSLEYAVGKSDNHGVYLGMGYGF